MFETSSNPKSGRPAAADGKKNGPPAPELIWPAADAAPGPYRDGDEPPVELTWDEDVEKIDEAIEDIRRITDGKDPAPEKDTPVAKQTGGAVDDIVAGSAGSVEPSSFAPAPEAACRVRPHSENEIGQLWTSIFFSTDIPAPKAIIVTSARRGDGATQIAAALALVGAEANSESRVCLVDFNLRNPGIARLLRLRNSPGLTDVLCGRLSLDRALHAMSLKNGKQLHVLPAGAPAEQPLGLVKSRQTVSLIAELCKRYDHTIIDTASANVYPDPQVIGANVNGALLVVQAGRTPRETAADAKKRLDLAGVRCLGLVMNQRTDPIPSVLYRMT